MAGPLPAARPPGPDADRQEAGIDPKQVNFVSYDGGGELLAAVLGGQVAFGVTGVGETKDQIEAGEIRALAVTSAEPVEGLDVKTLKEQGVDLEFTNWRGWVAPRGSARRQAELIDLATKMHDSQQWKDALTRTAGPTRSWSATSTPPSSRPRTSASATCSPSWGWRERLLQAAPGPLRAGRVGAAGRARRPGPSRRPGSRPTSPSGARWAPPAVPVVLGVALLVIAVLLARDVLQAATARPKVARTSTSATPATGAPCSC